jgi:beta-aspartyl-dipeptidase (metallo-type)
MNSENGKRYPAFLLIENAEVYAPKALGVQSVLLANEKIIKVGDVDRQALDTLGISYDVIDAHGMLLIPGLIDGHEHLIGAGGEEGFTSRLPEIPLSKIICAGITTVVGLLGTDTSARTLQCLHGKTSQLQDEGITAYMYTGGFELPPRSFFDLLMDDLVMIDKVIGTGEIAISDERYVDPQAHELAKVVTQTALGGKMAGKAGVTHFHVGSKDKRLSLLREILDEYKIEAKYLYPTHINRSKKLMDEAIKLAKHGSFVDIDSIDEDLAKQWTYYRDNDGPLEKLTFSSDSHTKGGSPEKLYKQFLSCVREHELPFEDILACLTTNPAEVLQLKNKGRIAEQMDADVVILEKDTFEIVHVIAKCRHFVKDAQLLRKSEQEELVEETLV